MKKNLYLFFIVFLFGTQAVAQIPKLKYIEYDLDNGLHVILQQDKSVPIVMVSVLYHVGSKNERPDRTGFAHFFEHLMFEGSEYIPRGEYAKFVEKAGGQLNANTTTDRTYYFEELPANQLELGLWLESERMLHLKVDSIGVATQKNVVIEEKKQSYDNRPYGSVLIEVMKRAFKKHPYHWTTIGDADHIRKATLEEFYEFYKTYYVPNNAVLTIVGDFDIAKTKELVKKYFGDIPRGTREMYRPDPNMEPKQTAEIRDTVYDNIQLPAVIMAYHTPAYGTKDYYAVAMLNKLMSEGKSSRLQKELVDKQEKALAVFSFAMETEHPGVTLVWALPNMGVSPQDLEKEIDKQFEKVRNEKISDYELQKLKNQIETEAVSNLATLSSRAYNLAIMYTYFKNTDLVNTEIQKYMAVTADDIQRVAKKYFVKQNRVVLYYLPKKDAK